MFSASSAFHVSLILTITDNFQADLLAHISLIGILDFHLLDILILLYSHVIFTFFSKSKKSSEIGIIFTFNLWDFYSLNKLPWHICSWCNLYSHWVDIIVNVLSDHILLIKVLVIITLFDAYTNVGIQKNIFGVPKSLILSKIDLLFCFWELLSLAVLSSL